LLTKAVQARAMEAFVRNRNQWLLVAVLTALLVGTTWYCVAVWRATPSMPLYGNIILGGAAILMLVLGCSLIALMFYSRRGGFDEPARRNRIQRE
jgi:MFS superfamily sulfate permease-like transporter